MKKQTALTLAAFAACAIAVAALALLRPGEPEAQEGHRMRVVVPAVPGGRGPSAAEPGGPERGGGYILKAPMEPGELVIAALSFDFDGDGVEDQVVAFRPSGPNGAAGANGAAGLPAGGLAGAGGSGEPISIAFFSFSERAGGHRRVWDLPTSATVPGTVSLFAMDILGDRSAAIIVTGMSDLGEEPEHAMTVFRKNPHSDPSRPFDVIADIRIDGSVAVREAPRSLAYQQGIARGQPFAIAATGRDPDSDNILDRIELTYSFNPASGAFQRSGSARIPGARIEQDRVRRILSGEPGVFEGFISDLWYHVTPQGTVDRSQFIFFDPARREIVFFAEDTQQIFSWQHSSATRQGIFISSHNSSVSAMRRRVSIELESMDSIRVTVTDDRRQRIGVPPPWSGSYRRAGAALRAAGEARALPPRKDAAFDSPIGRLRFMPCGGYELAALGSTVRGRYVFFRAGGMDMLELRPDPEHAAPGAGLGAFAEAAGFGGDRQVFQVSGISAAGRGGAPAYMSLSPARLGAFGARETRDARIALTRAD